MKADVAIIGAGFGGCLMALVLQRIGLRPIVIEKGSHPRFAIGESSTPLANLHLESICKKYDLPALLPLCKYGVWQKTYPELACGLKRGFSFFKHKKNKEFTPQPDHPNELLVAASPNDAVGDTQWFREHIDAFFCRQVVAEHILYSDNTIITEIVANTEGWQLHCRQTGKAINVHARFLIDATGAATALTKAFHLKSTLGSLRTNSWSVYSHFTGVQHWQEVFAQSGGLTKDHPFACDDAALHHVFDDGWMWVLRFNNGVTSAGFVVNGEMSPPPAQRKAEHIWQQLIAQYPSIAKQFSAAKRVQPFFYTKRLQRRVGNAVGKNWAMLPYSACFIDPLFSSGNAYTLLCIARLAEIFEKHWGGGEFTKALQSYEKMMQAEIDFLDQLIYCSHAAFRHFELFAAFSMYYFAGAIYSESRHRKGDNSPFHGFLFSDHLPFRKSFDKAYRNLLRLSAKSVLSKAERTGFIEQVAKDIAPYNLAGLCDAAKKNMYPFV